MPEVEPTPADEEEANLLAGELDDIYLDTLVPDSLPTPPPPEPAPSPESIPASTPARSDEPGPITSGQRKEAHKRAELMVTAIEQEERDHLIDRGLDRSGFLGSLLFRGRTIRKVDQENKFRVTAEMRDIIEEYTLQQVVGHHITASGKELYRLMEAYGFDIDIGDVNNIDAAPPVFIPTNADSTWLNRLIHIDRTKTTGAVFASGIVLGHTVKTALAGIIGGVVGGAAVGGFSGWLRGQREAAEAIGSGDAWVADMEKALNSGSDGAIEIACHKAERLMLDRAAQREFFRGRTHHEVVRILEKYQEGMKRLAMSRMATEMAENKKPNTTEKEFKSIVADIYRGFNEQMAGVEETITFVYEGSRREEKPTEKVDRRRIADEEGFERIHGAEYLGAFARELSIIRGEIQMRPANLDDIGAREAVLAGYNLDRNLRRNIRLHIVAGHIVRGALTGGIAGGVGYYFGNLLSGVGGHEGTDVGSITSPDTGQFPDSGAWGHFGSENAMSDLALTQDRVHALGLDSLIQDQRCPSSFIEGQLLYGTDQGAALREAALTWKDQLNFHGMDQNRIINLMSFGGSRNAVDLGAEYSFSFGQVQSVIDHINSVGEDGIFDTNSIMAVEGLSQLEGAVGTSVEQGAKGLWPGWLLLAGAVGYEIDSGRRNADINETNRQASTSPIGPPLGDPQMGRYIRTFASERPGPEPEPAMPHTGAAGTAQGARAARPAGSPSEIDRKLPGAEPEPEPKIEPAVATPPAEEEPPIGTPDGRSKEDFTTALEASRTRLSEISGEQRKLRDRFGAELDRDARLHRAQLKVGNNEPLFSVAEMTNLLEQEGVNPDNITSEAAESSLAATLKSKIEDAYAEKGPSFQKIADVVMESRTQKNYEADPRLTSIFTRGDIRALMSGTDRSNTVDFPQQIQERLAAWTERQAEQVAHAWMLLLAKEKINDLDLEKDKIEKDIAAIESEQSSGGWFGDWAKGERPEGYIAIEDRLENLERRGFKISEVMEQADINKLDALYTRAKHPIDKLPTLSAAETALLLRLNKELAGHMDNFEASQRGENK